MGVEAADEDNEREDEGIGGAKGRSRGGDEWRGKEGREDKEGAVRLDNQAIDDVI